MPRLPPSLFWRARREISPMVAQLLPACRDLESATNELRWIREHVRDTESPVPPGLRVWELVEKRGKGVPLQYVLGTQPFGDLEIKCKPGVLIPRPETESYTLHLASLLSQPTRPPPSSLNILDLCTGTGCIPLLLLSSLLSSLPREVPIHLQGVDVSPLAITLARQNYAHNISLGNLPPPRTSSEKHTLTFTQADIFTPNFLSSLLRSSHPQSQRLDLLVSNPPYISPSHYRTTTARSVRNYEPVLALVPSSLDPAVAQRYRCDPADVFYARILELSGVLRPRRVFVEVGGLEQAGRVVALAMGREDVNRVYGRVEVWRDEPGLGGSKVEVVGGREVVVRGEGSGRGVYLERIGE
ncbi:hypothetical protein VTI74DRAFT_7075 [Chaetomium olivicolor]